MVQEQADFARLRYQLQTVFTPGAPVSERELLAGRIDEISKVIGAVSQVGRHVLIYGERGVGKTSLAGLIHEIWVDVAKNVDSLIAPRVNCDTSDDYQSLWLKIADEMMLIFEKYWRRYCFWPCASKSAASLTACCSKRGCCSQAF